MKILVHIGPTERKVWRREKNGWQEMPADYKFSQPVWVVTDLAEETFDEIDLPRVFGRDHADLVERKLAGRFPSTPYRAVLKLPSRGRLIDRIAPVKRILIGVDASARLNSELNDIPDLAAICPISLLLARFGCHEQLPADLFVVMPGVNTLRIVFLKNRLPVLTRLAPVTEDLATHVEELSKTLRYLENSRVLDRGQATPPILMLGNGQAYAGLLATVRLRVVAPPSPWAETPPPDWRLPLFDLALKMPYAQVAPFERRTRYLARRTQKLALKAASAGLGLAILASSSNLLRITETWYAQEQAEFSMQQLNAESKALEQRTARFVVSPDRVRRAVELNHRELVAAPVLAPQLQRIASALALDGGKAGAQLNLLEWRLLDAEETPCERSAASTAVARAVTNRRGGAQLLQGGQQRLEVNLELNLPEGQSEPERARMMRNISQRLGTLPGALLLQDPVRTQGKSSLRGGGAITAERRYSWCMSLPWGGTATESTPGGLPTDSHKVSGGGE